MEQMLQKILYEAELIIPPTESAFNFSMVRAPPSSREFQRIPTAFQLVDPDIPIEPVELSQEVSNPYLRERVQLAPILSKTMPRDIFAEQMRILSQVDWEELKKIASLKPANRPSTLHLITILDKLGMKMPKTSRPNRRVDPVSTLLNFRPIWNQYQKQAILNEQQKLLYSQQIINQPVVEEFVTEAPTVSYYPTELGYSQIYEQEQ